MSATMSAHGLTNQAEDGIFAQKSIKPLSERQEAGNDVEAGRVLLQSP